MYGRYSQNDLELIEAGADVNAKDKEGRTTLKLAASTGRTDLTQILKTYGAKE